MSSNKKAPAANEGCNKASAQSFYHEATSIPKGLNRWLNPRRRDYAARLLNYIFWCGGKIRLTDECYAEIMQGNATAGISRHMVDDAVDALYALGSIDLRQSGDTWTVVALGSGPSLWGAGGGQ